jgi:hypothetical protein
LFNKWRHFAQDGSAAAAFAPKDLCCDTPAFRSWISLDAAMCVKAVIYEITQGSNQWAIQGRPGAALR